MTQKQMEDLMHEIFTRCHKARAAGHREYAHGDCFDNFNVMEKDLGIPRMTVLWIFLTKHMRGILAYINGHKSQREDVRGRIVDAIVYLCLLWGMADEDVERGEEVKS